MFRLLLLKLFISGTGAGSGGDTWYCLNENVQSRDIRVQVPTSLAGYIQL